MRSRNFLAGACALISLLVSACAQNTSLNPAATADIQTALAIGCPIVTAIQGSSLKLNAYQKSALTTLALVCPPNPAPTTEFVAITDVIAAYTILQPLLK